MSPLAQPLMNVGFWLDGWDVSVTETSSAVPFSADTSTTYVALWPRWMLACPRWTLTHSSGAGVVSLALALELALGLVLGLELALAVALGFALALGLVVR